MKNFYIYLLAGMKRGEFSNFYIGQVEIMDNQFDEHMVAVIKKDTKKYAKRFEKIKMVWCAFVHSKEEANTIGEEIKKLPREEKLNLIQHFKAEGNKCVNFEDYV